MHPKVGLRLMVYSEQKKWNQREYSSQLVTFILCGTDFILFVKQKKIHRRLFVYSSAFRFTGAVGSARSLFALSATRERLVNRNTQPHHSHYHHHHHHRQRRGTIPCLGFSGSFFWNCTYTRKKKLEKSSNMLFNDVYLLRGVVCWRRRLQKSSLSGH